MSTKIHHGYRIDDGLLDERSFVAAARGIFGPLYSAGYLAVAVPVAVHVADWRDAAPGRDLDLGAVATGDPGADVAASNELPPLWIADRVMARTHEAIQTSGRRNPAFDLSCDIVLLRDHGADGALYALLYTEHAPYRRTWESMDAVAWFGYWNSTERPDDLTEAEWDARRDTWARLLPRFDPPAIRGLSWSLIGDMHRTSLVEVAKDDPAAIEMAVPSNADRRRVLAAAGLEVDASALRDVTAEQLLA